MNKTTQEQLEVMCSQSKFCDGCEHSEKHIKGSFDFADDCEGFVCQHYNKFAECVTPENVIKKLSTQEQLNEILERVEEGTTTQADADVLRKMFRHIWASVYEISNSIEFLFASLPEAR